MQHPTISQTAYETELSADPQTAFAILDKPPDLHFLLRVRWDTKRDGKKLAGAISLKTKQPRIRARPNTAAAVFIEIVHTIGGSLITHGINVEARARFAVRVKPEDASPVGTNPIGAISGLDQPVYVGVRQTILLGIVGEAISVKAAQAE